MRRHCRRNDDFLCDIRELKYLETGGCECLDDRHRLVEKVRLEQLVLRLLRRELLLEHRKRDRLQIDACFLEKRNPGSCLTLDENDPRLKRKLTNRVLESDSERSGRSGRGAFEIED